MIERIKKIINEEKLEWYCQAVIQWGEKVKIIPKISEPYQDGGIFYSNNELWTEESLRKELIEDLKIGYFRHRNSFPHP